MHDTLEYMSKDPIHRGYHHNDLTFSMMYAYSENFILPLSHDEVVHGKGSLLRKMPGDEWRRFANLRLLFAYMCTHPGKKLLMAGSEFAPWDEWNHEGSLPRELAVLPGHGQIARFMRDLGKLYNSESSLWQWDHEPRGFQWIDCNDHLSSVISFLRTGPDGFLVCVFNFTPVVREGYVVGVPEPGEYEEALNSDSRFYGGSDVGNAGRVAAKEVPQHGFDRSVELILPPLAALVLRKV
jgi:1,4-alpha-glucan branching enzyme